jgi:predicted membrane-bound spermidine synthase
MADRVVTTPALSAAGGAFFVSGVSALVYQIAWQRILSLHSGVGIYSVAMIVAAFMAGLGVGSHLGGVLSARSSRAGALRAFAGLELGIAAFGAASSWIYYDWLYLRAGWLYEPAWRAGLMHGLGFLLPTCLMGMSLPFLVRAMVRDVAGAGRTIGVLYGINMLGASVGAGLTPWVLIRYFGIRGALVIAALGNLAAGLTALGLYVRLRSRPGETTDPSASSASFPSSLPSASSASSPSTPFTLWVALYAASGFCALALEILWFRLIDVAVKSRAYTFGTVLAIYLAGAAAGSLAGAAMVDRIRRPLRAFLTCQCLLMAYSGATVALLAYFPAGTWLYRWYFEYWRHYDGFSLGQSGDLLSLSRLYLLLPCALYAVPTLLMGLSFPILQRAVQDDPRTAGRKVGFLQAANIAGCVAGSLVVGLVLLERIGTTGTLRVLLAVAAGLAVLGAREGAARWSFGALAALLLVGSSPSPARTSWWRRLHGRDGGDDRVPTDEDATGVGALTLNPWQPGEWQLSCNGKGQGALPFFQGHTLLGAVPAILHPAPRDVAVVGLGTGGTAWAAGCRPETASVTVFEIFGPQPRLIAGFPRLERYAPLEAFLRDPRVHVEVRDGRNALDHTARRFDLIEADPIFPDRAYSGNLNSVEFFRLCARRLKPGGMMCAWTPTARIYASFHAAFPHVVGLENRSIVVGSNEPIAEDVKTWAARATSPEVAAYLGAELSQEVVKRVVKCKALVRTGRRTIDTNQDLYPRDEFLSP